MTGTALVYGIAVSGDALSTELVRRGWSVLVADDAPSDAKRGMAAALGTTLVECPDAFVVHELLAAADIVCPAPGVAETHGGGADSYAAGQPVCAKDANSCGAAPSARGSAGG